MDTSIRIIDLLKSQKLDITTSDIANKLCIDRHTAAKHLEKLAAKGIIESRNVGKSKMWKINDAPLIRALNDNDALSDNLRQVLSSLEGDVSIQGTNHRIAWSNNITDKGHQCYVVHTKKKIKCTNCPMEKTFKTGKVAQAIIPSINGKVKIITKPIKDDSNKTIAVVEIVKKVK